MNKSYSSGVLNTLSHINVSHIFHNRIFSVSISGSYNRWKNGDSQQHYPTMDYSAGNKSGKGEHSKWGDSGKKLTAFVIDDPFCQKVEWAFLESLGVQVHCVDTANDAFKLIADGRSFDLIFLCWVLPEINGFITTRILHQMGVQRKILGLCVLTIEQGREPFLEAGADEYHEKPLTAAKVVPFLRQIDPNYKLQNLL